MANTSIYEIYLDEKLISSSYRSDKPYYEFEEPFYKKHPKFQSDTFSIEFNHITKIISITTK